MCQVQTVRKTRVRQCVNCTAVQTSRSPYIPRPRGEKPDSRRRLRRKPVRRDEIRVYRKVDGVGKPQWLVTMPPGTYRLEELSKHFVGDPALWKPLADELAAQYAPRKLEIFIFNAFEYHCEHCGLPFLAHRIAGNKVRLCSDKCGRERRNAKQRHLRATIPPDQRCRYHRARHQQRAATRPDRTCEHCGVALEMTRSDRRFCSNRCRIRVYRQRQRQAAHQPGVATGDS